MFNKIISEFVKANVFKLVVYLEMIGKWGKIKRVKFGKNLNVFFIDFCRYMLSRVWISDLV